MQPTGLTPKTAESQRIISRLLIQLIAIKKVNKRRKYDCPN